MKPDEYTNISVRTNLPISLRKIDELSEEIINEADIIDLKDPLNGSIGAWDLQDIKKVISIFKNQIQISATLGDIFINDTFLIKLKQFDKLNLDYIKFGLLSMNIKNLCITKNASTSRDMFIVFII